MDTEAVVQGLTDVGYTGPLLDSAKFTEALQTGAKSPAFTKLISWLTDQIGSFSKIDETVQPTSTPEDSSHFLLELSTYLKELGCINVKLTTGNVNQRLANIDERLMLIEYLISELMACKISETKKEKDKKAVQITISESITAKCMREMLSALRFQKPPDNISPSVLFSKLQTKVADVMKQVPKELVGKPLFYGVLNSDQWEKLDKLHSEMNEEYTIRREMLLKRLDVTVQSFTWSERIRPKEDELNKCYNLKRDAMRREPDVTLAHLLAARDDLAVIEKTSSASVRKNTKSSINKVIIGAVPDRGGRPGEQPPPPPEIPSWQKDKVQGPQRGGFGGYRDNKSASSNFGQNFDKPQQQQFTSYSNPSPQYTQASGFGGGYGGNQNSFSSRGQGFGYNNRGGGFGNQSYGNQNSGGFGNQNYGNQSSGGYGNQGGYDRKSGGGQNRGGRVQGGWNQGGDSGYNNRNQGQGGGRRY
ncbi:protein FAM98B isoform X2 [Copidosoma floridanum]|uniref:protein FAM98B isoform X2 n=1 Tax=Copidosoma floridanum TaxID=29053 RepID=UPI0006C9C70D|nr:protein FAM98B isoform X2 [Copidosoma floridanum]